MSRISPSQAKRIVAIAAAVVVCKVLVEILRNYPDYLPPNFAADFLLGREGYFWRGYHLSFYVHLTVGPVTLVLGMLLISDRFRSRWPRWHRRLGRAQASFILALLVPSGLWMAAYAASGPIAGAGLAVLAVLTGASVALGWRAAVSRQFNEHRRWMMRCYLCLCSTVILRLMGGVGMVLEIGAPWYGIQATWTSWAIPLLAYEVWLRRAGLPFVGTGLLGSHKVTEARRMR